ncbi:DUF935 domain-containing protein [Martelella radicis]|uniref:Phage gp29-like protein n=1 Tax=Martelella radicis TaxID=1397476 RepID=A0A7W6KKW7_9HYPH|nr:DUF935 domain-containing protein [Martelella radicis]MBB4122925.1 phage gp29-like protein [Martelella radicis]
MALRDFLNRVINGRQLTEHVATGKTGTVRDPYGNDQADGLTPQRLARILRAAANGDPLAYFELAENMEERDPHYLAVLATRKRSVAQLPITVNAASDAADHKKHAEYLQSWIDDGVLRSSLFDMLDAIGKGFSVMEIEWKTSVGSWTPGKLIWRPPTFFDFDRDDGETLMLREAAGLVDLDPAKFIIHRSKAKSGLTVKSGIARVAAWGWMFKNFTLKDWAIFCQNYGQPIRVGKYDSNATEEQKDILWKAVSQIAGDCAAIIPRSMEIAFQEVGSKSASTDMFEKRVDWYDRQVSKLVLGQTTTTDAISGGHAVSQEHREVQEDIERSDALDLSTTLNLQLVRNMIAFKFGPQDHYPTLSIGRPDEVPLGEFANAFDIFARNGLKLPANFVRSRLGAPAPEGDEETVGGRPEAAPLKMTARQAVDRLFETSAHARKPDRDDVEHLTDRLEAEAAAILDGQIDTIRTALNQATSLEDAAQRLAKLDLKDEELAKAMASAMMVSHLAGQAALLDGLDDERK